MTRFESIHGSRLIGTLTTFDRMIFKGHLTGLYPSGAFKAFLCTQGVLLKSYAAYVKKVSEGLKAHAQRLAADAGRPYLYAEHAMTKRSGTSKGDVAEEIALRDGITSGLVCVISAVEPCSSFDVVGNRATHLLEVIRRRRKCLYFYFYFVHPTLGLIHLRLQSWFPFEVQVYMNGREILARCLDARGIGYGRHANAFTTITNLDAAQNLAARLAHRRWHVVLGRLVRQVNPFLPTIESAGFGSYWWVLDQAEVATDVMFASRGALEEILPPPLRPCLPRVLCRGRLPLPRPQALRRLLRRGHDVQAPAPGGLEGQAHHEAQLDQGLRQGIGAAGGDHDQQSA